MKYEKKSTFFMGLLLIIIAFIFIVILVSSSNKSNVDTLDNSTSGDAILLEDTNRFFTVSSCITKYITYLSNGDNEKVFDVLDSNYINDNSITKENVFNYITPLNGTYSQSSIRMYYEELNSYTIKYYVKYNLSPMTINGVSNGTTQYIIVVLDQSKLVFSIIPYDGEMFTNE